LHALRDLEYAPRLGKARQMAGIFINYRTGDGQQAASLLNRALRPIFGEENVFLDSISLSAGDDFPPELERRLIASTVLVVLIGQHWLTLTDAGGNRRIDDPKDYVRYEIQTSLGRRITVLPILLDGAALPGRTELPKEIEELSNRQTRTLRSREVAVDLAQIVTDLKKHIPSTPLSSDPAKPVPGIRKAKVRRGVITNGDYSTGEYYEGRGHE
jgi:hypothetical protein